MLDKTTVGLWCRSDRNWYYLETGGHTSVNALSKIRGTLMTRGLLAMEYSTLDRQAEPAIQMTYAEAQEKGYDVKPIFLSAHIRKIYESKELEKVESPWS